MKDALIISLLSVLPRKGFSWTQGAIARKKASKALLNWYVRHYKVNTDEMEGVLEDYDSLADFFVRPLKSGARVVVDLPDSVASPCDGVVASLGHTQAGMLALQDGQELPVSELLGEQGDFEDGAYMVIYLAPPDYHRVHFPLDGELTGYRYLPGHLWPVFPAAVRTVKKLFAKNERLVVFQDCRQAGRVALVMVGAYGVGRIETVFCDLLTNAGSKGHESKLEGLAPVERGQELGRFNMGSTVVLFFQKDRIEWSIESGDPVKMGQEIAKLRSKAH